MSQDNKPKHILNWHLNKIASHGKPSISQKVKIKLSYKRLERNKAQENVLETERKLGLIVRIIVKDWGRKYLFAEGSIKMKQWKGGK